ncbi:phosphotransferase KptA/Tpt1 [Conidiobolus coronatus NRRL 28638]|uniref:2'-phosphotransferase n=1 Tax=Conidiobolus coronatus (strain ATCC 28846 / CBS 209.66 / NRRL 28638) TaxID=796925 RepID=A0A137NT31_CONC2|nr:phosphotransferase KptA/Tpt1 [Conidiobolus coronatus NRRL 28638]|eukprot:KXN65869.1 phosphotransferase KptA/Tpt1 [Conidiobolus coronatus NRRL 28638]
MSDIKKSQPSKRLVKLSKLLSLTLRHKAIDQGFKINSEGYINLYELLNSDIYKNYKLDEIVKVVKDNEKNRFKLSRNPSDESKTEENLLENSDEVNYWFIKANQGHSIQIENLELTPILNHSDFPTIIHGTYEDKWELIKTQGLNRMSRNHIHFSIGLPGDGEVISGMRTSCKVLIYINLKKAIEDKIPFYISSNKVVLCPGILNTGILTPEYFEKVVSKSGIELEF